MAVGVLDTSVVLMILNDEPGAADNPQLFQGGLLSTVNLAEIYTKFDKWGVPDDDANAMLGGLPTVLVELDAALAKRAGRLRQVTRKQGLSLGDLINEVASHLGSSDGSDVSITVEINAKSAGFDDRTRRTVSENAAQLGFETHEFEE